MQLRYYSRWPHSFLQDNTLHTAYISYIILCTSFIMCCIFAGDSMLMSSHGVDTMDVFEFSMCSSGS